MANSEMGQLIHLQGFISSSGYAKIIGILLAGLWLSLLLSQHRKPKVRGAPTFGSHWWWEPGLLTQSRFTFGARDIIAAGYRKFKHRPFVVRRFDVDITVLPNKYLSELRLVPPTQLSAVKAQVDNLGHKWTHTTIMTESNLHFRVIQNKLIPELPKYLDIAKEELDYAWEIEIPHSKEWQEVNIQQVMRMLVARMSAKVFMGYPACRDVEWLNLSIDFSIDMFTAAFTLRMFPPYTHPVIAHLIPARYRINRNLKTAERIIRPLMDMHRAAARKRAMGEQVDEDDTLLNWMMDHGDEKENVPENMSVRQAILTLASIHTTSIAVANILFDLCAWPEWFPILREEISQITDELGPIESGLRCGAKDWLSRLEKLDSFFIESQRFNPPILLGPQRVALETLTLKDGTYIPAGSRISWAGHHHLNDPAVTPEPELFDPMRSYRKRHSSADNMNKHLAGQTNTDNVSFGYGKLACPGRAFAVGEIKLILARLIHQFEFKFPDGKSRPVNMYADENVFPDPEGRVMMRLRQR
ncbi:cytochrome P450 [Annulohypoxylon truncatum]|uniref:cytochrome P450 n=1 Tax=Annulohypoxylon truncatum TaxID=327061 RepID=UPI002008678F|nr:cytochrome P450 [Annulohypoxylon truncatum]KAI1213723.1 cytochrome P450 [Annulohypoxylon truncatum]